MTTFFNFLTHAVILAGLLGLVFFISVVIRSTEELSEKLIRLAAAMTGFLIYFGSRAEGFSIPALLLPAIADANPYKAGLIGMLIPAGCGVLVAWHGLRCLGKGGDVSWRLLLLGTTLGVALFGDVYAGTFTSAFVKDGFAAALLPNLAFQTGLTLHLIFHYQAKAQVPKDERMTPRPTFIGVNKYRASARPLGIKVTMGN